MSSKCKRGRPRKKSVDIIAASPGSYYEPGAHATDSSSWRDAARQWLERYRKEAEERDPEARAPRSLWQKCKKMLEERGFTLPEKKKLKQALQSLVRNSGTKVSQKRLEKQARKRLYVANPEQYREEAEADLRLELKQA